MISLIVMSLNWFSTSNIAFLLLPLHVCILSHFSVVILSIQMRLNYISFCKHKWHCKFCLKTWSLMLILTFVWQLHLKKKINA